MDRGELEREQLQKLRRMLVPVLERNAFYRSKLEAAGLVAGGPGVATLEELRRWPLTTKEELSADQEATPPFGTNLTEPIGRYVRIHQTSGTSGRPLRCVDTAESWAWWGRCWAMVYDNAGVTAADRIFFAFSFGPFIGFWSAFEGARQVGALALAGGGMTSLQRLHAMLDNQATVLVCTPTYALHLAAIARKQGIDLTASRVRTTIHAGEPGANIESTRRRIEEAWGATCFDHAGATEVGAWGFECRERAGLHLNENEFIGEVVDPVTGEPADAGELVITNLGRIGMPVIRYRTGDKVEIDPTPCPCGRPFVRFRGGVVGRIDDVLVIRGVNVFPSAIENIVRRFPEVGEFAVDVCRRGELDEIELRVEVEAGLAQDLAVGVTEALREALGLRAHVIPVAFETLPRYGLKARRFRDHRLK